MRISHFSQIYSPTKLVLRSTKAQLDIGLDAVTKWCVLLYPNGNQPERAGFVSLYLYRWAFSLHFLTQQCNVAKIKNRTVKTNWQVWNGNSVVWHFYYSSMIDKALIGRILKIRHDTHVNYRIFSIFQMGQTDRAGCCHLQVLPPEHRHGEVLRGWCRREEDVRSLGGKL